MRKSNWTNREVSDLCRSLGLLLHAGVDLGGGVLLLSEEQTGPQRETLAQIARRLDEGAFLSEALAECAALPGDVAGMVAVGERTGRTEQALTALAAFYDRREQQDYALRSALLYPSILLVLMLVVIVVLLAEVLPVFEGVYASLGGQLTGLAGGLLQVGRVLDAGMPVLVVLLAAVSVALVLFSASESFREWVQSAWNRRRPERGLAARQNAARFAQAMAMAMGSGLPLEEAVELAGGLLAAAPGAAQRCARCAEALRAGEELAPALEETRLLPASACRMLALGDRSGDGDAVMAQIAQRLAQDADRALSEAVARVEPVMVLATSLLVGVILLSVMLPLMNIMSVIG